jgi:hypothetical protein
MQNDLIKFSDMAPMMDMAKAFVESGIFPDIKNAAMAFVKIQAGQELGVAPFAAMSGIHIIQGKATIGAGLMASQVRATGKYDYKVLQQDDKACSLDFYRGKEKLGNSIFTIADAQKAGTKNLDKYARNMLFARAMSNGVKWYCPDVFNQPVYTPEEFDQTPQDTPASEVPTPPGAKAEPAKVIPGGEPEKKPKPAASDLAMNRAFNKITNGEIGIVDKMTASFTLTTEQVAQLTTCQAEFDLKNTATA